MYVLEFSPDVLQACDPISNSHSIPGHFQRGRPRVTPKCEIMLITKYCTKKTAKLERDDDDDLSHGKI